MRPALASVTCMTSRRRATRFSSAFIGLPLLLTACGASDSDNLAESDPAGDDVEVVTVTQYNDGTVLGPDDEVEAEEPEADDAGGAEETDDADTGTEEDAQDEETSDLAPGETEYFGTVEKQNVEQVLKGRPNPNPSYDTSSSRYYVLVLDEPVEVTGNKGGNHNHSQVNEIISLGDNNGIFDSSERWEPYVGKRIRLIVTDGELNYPSDTSLPLGALSLVEDGGRIEEL